MRFNKHLTRPEADRNINPGNVFSIRAVVLPVLYVAVVFISGCGNLRFAPDQKQKQNAYLHHRTVQTAAIKAQQETTSATLQELTGQATRQSEAILAYYGLPQEIPPSQTVAEILSEENRTVTEQARAQALQRPDPWDTADNLLELGIALAGVFGGVFGARAAAALQTARKKSTALREIVKNNELFKQENPESAPALKKSQQRQSESTRTLVASMK